MLDIKDIMNILPHRYPFLLVDRVSEMVEGESAKGYKNITMNEPFFQGHFPGEPVMPGVLMVEALAQVGAVALLSKEEYQGKIVYFAGIDNVRFKRKVVPGDRLDLEVTITKLRGPIGKGEGKAYVDGELACSCTLMFAVEID